jgi:hypothetical protein
MARAALQGFTCGNRVGKSVGAGKPQGGRDPYPSSAASHSSGRVEVLAALALQLIKHPLMVGIHCCRQRRLDLAALQIEPAIRPKKSFTSQG